IFHRALPSPAERCWLYANAAACAPMPASPSAPSSSASLCSSNAERAAPVWARGDTRRIERIDLQGVGYATSYAAALPTLFALPPLASPSSTPPPREAGDAHVDRRPPPPRRPEDGEKSPPRKIAVKIVVVVGGPPPPPQAPKPPRGRAEGAPA